VFSPEEERALLPCQGEQLRHYDGLRKYKQTEEREREERKERKEKRAAAQLPHQFTASLLNKLGVLKAPRENIWSRVFFYRRGSSATSINAPIFLNPIPQFTSTVFI
jgi:hypothetical protein